MKMLHALLILTFLFQFCFNVSTLGAHVHYFEQETTVLLSNIALNLQCLNMAVKDIILPFNICGESKFPGQGKSIYNTDYSNKSKQKGRLVTPQKLHASSLRRQKVNPQNSIKRSLKLGHKKFAQKAAHLHPHLVFGCNFICSIFQLFIFSITQTSMSISD